MGPDRPNDAADPGRPETVAADLPPAPRELPHHFVRRWWRSLARHSGLRYWFTTRGVPLVATLAVLYIVNGVTIGWHDAYDVAIQITSPAAVRVPILPWLLSLAGWLVAPGIAGAVAGYVVSTAIESQRTSSAERLVPRTRTNDDRDGRPARTLIPLLEELCRPDNAFGFNPRAATHLVEEHDRDWRAAQSHLERLMQRLLNTDAVAADAYAGDAIAQAADAAGSLLSNTKLGGRCPICADRGRTRTRKEGVGR